MKHVFLVTSLLVLSGLAFVPGAQADALAADPCPQQPGYVRCAASAGPCEADVRYYQHDSFFTESAACQSSNLHCGYYSHSLYGEWTGFDCKFITPGAASAASDSTSGASGASVANDVCQQQGSGRDCTVESGGCVVGVRYDLGSGRVEPVHYCIDAASASEPSAVGAPTTSAALCQQEPGYRDCTVESGGCTVGVRYYQHDAKFQPVSYCVAGTSADGTAEDCTQYPGYEVCEYEVAGVCVLRATVYYHDQIYMYEPLCDKAPLVIGGPPSATATTVAADEPVDCYGPLDGWQYCEAEVGKCHAGEELWQGTWHVHAECQPNDGKSRCGVDVTYAPLEVWRHCGSTYERVYPPERVAATAAAPSAVDPCEEKPGYRECRYGTEDCGVYVRYFYHDAFYQVDPYCYKATGASAASADPVDCQGTDGLLTCETQEIAGCGAGFYSRDETRWAYAGCQDPTGPGFCGVDYDPTTHYRFWFGCH